VCGVERNTTELYTKTKTKDVRKAEGNVFNIRTVQLTSEP